MKRERFKTLVVATLGVHSDLGLSPDMYLDALDCAMSLPEMCIPDKPSLRFFVYDFIQVFTCEMPSLNETGEFDVQQVKPCFLHYPRMTEHVLKWKTRWSPTGSRPHVPLLKDAYGSCYDGPDPGKENS
jgi:hypothetical protein